LKHKKRNINKFIKKREKFLFVILEVARSATDSAPIHMTIVVIVVKHTTRGILSPLFGEWSGKRNQMKSSSNGVDIREGEVL
jgi:hypothetical protein